jgi:putative alpha-1,2-mannosidase
MGIQVVAAAAALLLSLTTAQVEYVSTVIGTGGMACGNFSYLATRSRTIGQFVNEIGQHDPSSAGIGFGIGSLNPGAQVPFGALRLGPDTTYVDPTWGQMWVTW